MFSHSAEAVWLGLGQGILVPSTIWYIPGVHVGKWHRERVPMSGRLQPERVSKDCILKIHHCFRGIWPLEAFFFFPGTMQPDTRLRYFEFRRQILLWRMSSFPPDSGLSPNSEESVAQRFLSHVFPFSPGSLHQRVVFLLAFHHPNLPPAAKKPRILKVVYIICLHWAFSQRLVRSIREVLHSLRRNFLDGMLRSGCEFRILIPKRSLKRSIETESERNSVDHFRKVHSLVPW